ncbi:hypothetical protein AAVH_06485 [Aphelenchoides avenae]|nr:hypothetical protein AAVH_06485 [Aphelenchus avenae]
MEETRPPKQLNPAIVRMVVEKQMFKKPPLGFGKAVNAGKTPLDKLREKYQFMFLDRKWSRSFVEVLHSLKHVTIGGGFEGFYVSAVADGTFTDKKIGIDAELLRYLFKELGACFQSLRICTTHVESSDGKELPATGVAVDAEIEGLSSLSFESIPITEEEFEQLLADAETLIHRNGATLRELKCGGNGARFAKMLPPTAVLESLDVRLDDYNPRLGYTLEEIATVLRANATAIQIRMDTGCESSVYTAGAATACRKLKVVRGQVPEGGEEDLEDLLKCVTAVGERLKSVEILLQGHSANDNTVADFFSFVDARTTQYAKAIQSVASKCPTAVHASFDLTYFCPHMAADFVEQFQNAYPSVSTTTFEDGLDEPNTWTLKHTVDLGEGRTLLVDVSVDPMDDQEIVRMMYEDNLEHEFYDGASDFDDADAYDEWDDADALEVDDDDEF